jgi:hypothetical protein
MVVRDEDVADLLAGRPALSSRRRCACRSVGCWMRLEQDQVIAPASMRPQEGAHRMACCRRRHTLRPRAPSCRRLARICESWCSRPAGAANSSLAGPCRAGAPERQLAPGRASDNLICRPMRHSRPCRARNRNRATGFDGAGPWVGRADWQACPWVKLDLDYVSGRVAEAEPVGAVRLGRVRSFRLSAGAGAGRTAPIAGGCETASTALTVCRSVPLRHFCTSTSQPSVGMSAVRDQKRMPPG